MERVKVTEAQTPEPEFELRDLWYWLIRAAAVVEGLSPDDYGTTAEAAEGLDEALGVVDSSEFTLRQLAELCNRALRPVRPCAPRSGHRMGGRRPRFSVSQVIWTVSMRDGHQ